MDTKSVWFLINSFSVYIDKASISVTATQFWQINFYGLPVLFLYLIFIYSAELLEKNAEIFQKSSDTTM